jgi:hypothetical protein
LKGFDDHLDNYGDPGGYYGEAGTRNPEEPASAAYLPAGHFDTPEGSVYIPSEAELDVDEARSVFSWAEYLAAEADVIAGKYPDIEAALAVRHLQEETSSRMRAARRAAANDYTLDRLKTDINALLAYNWQDEERDYYKQNPDERDGHIFVTMCRINDWINT